MPNVQQVNIYVQKLNTKRPFSERLKALRDQSRMSQVEFAKKLFISRGLYNGLETGREKPSKWIVQQVDMLERVGVELLNKPTPSDTIAESDPIEMPPGDDHEPTREQCEAFFRRYLDEAEKIPGGIGHTWVQLRLNFSTEELIRLSKQQ